MTSAAGLPVFRYHPDPLRSGSVVASEATCLSCREARGFIYTGPAYAEAELEDALCPWCIADGRAHAAFDATFHDEAAFPDAVPADAIVEVATRTPGFNDWQGVEWPACCDDLTAFVEPAGYAEIQEAYPRLEGQLVTHIVHEVGLSGGAAIQYLKSLDRDRGPTAYIFRCLHCDGWAVRTDAP